MIPKFDIYSDSYYESLNGTFEHQTAYVHNYGFLSTFIRGCLVLLLRAGFVLVQLGSVPIENVYIIVLQNIIDIAVSIASFGLVGYILAFGFDSLNGLVGHGMWLISDAADLDNAVFGFSACIIATGIITTLLSGRVHFVGYFLTTLLYSALFQPLIMHWIWHDNGWLHYRYFMEHLVSLKDHAGGLVVHFSAGIVGFVGALFLGRRLMRLSDIDESSIGSESPGSTITGYIFIAVGLIAFSLPPPSYELTHVPGNYIGIVLVNNIMAIAAGIIVVVILQFLFYREPFNYWIILRCIQGAIAGIVSISSGVDVYTPVLSYVIASGAAVLFYFVVICVHNSSVEDYCNIVPIHLVCGCLGVILPPLLGSTENLGSSTSFHIRLIHLGWQIVGAATVCVGLTIVFTLHFAILSLTGFLRNTTEEINHRRGVTAAVRGPERCFLQRLFALYPNTPFIEPGSAGKNPRKFQSHRKSFELASNTMPGFDTKYLKKAAVVNNSVQIANAKVDYDSTPFQMKKSKSIFTISNFKKAGENAKARIGSIGGSGDTERTPDKDYTADTERNPTIQKNYVEQKLNEMAISVGKQFSYYELHRTKKYTNLLRNRYAIRKRTVKATPISNLPQSTECVEYDNTCNDGFVTIKMPMDMVHLSDASD